MACAHKLILSFVKGCRTLSVTYGDSSPRGRAKGLYSIVPEFYDVAVGQLSQRESQGAAPRYIACWHEKWSVSVSIRSIHCFTATPQKDCGGLFCEHLRRFSALTAAGAIAAAAGFPAAEQDQVHFILTVETPAFSASRNSRVGAREKVPSCLPKTALFGKHPSQSANVRAFARAMQRSAKKRFEEASAFSKR